MGGTYGFCVDHRRISLALTTVIALSVGMAAPASAAPDAVDREAARILATATAGEPLTVVTTTETADGPQFATTTVDSRDEALDLISTTLEKSGGPKVSVDLSHPVSIAARSPRRANDSYRDEQWGLSRMQGEKVWRKSAGKGVVVAVIDTGVRAKHPDLRGRVLRGWDFLDSDSDASDANGHGTHVAGVIAARSNNRRGIAGLAHEAKILPIRVLDANGNGNTATVARGIRYAVRRGADVINLSLAGRQGDRHVASAVSYAVRKGVVVVAAAGNSGCGTPTSYSPAYPAAYRGVIAVGAVDRSLRVSAYSNCGSYVDVVAPGSGIVSTMINRPRGGLGCEYGVGYCSLSGTSMATPYASAAAAVLISRTKHRLGGAKVRALMTGRADDIGTPGRDPFAGYGLVNPWRMLRGR